MTIRTGQKAPLFTLFDSEKKPVSLEGLIREKNILILFFPLAFTSVCTKELCSVRDNISQYELKDVQVLGISVDSVYTLAKYKAEQQLNFPLLSDFNKEVSRDYGTLYDLFSGMHMKGVSKRSAFLVGRDGLVKYAEVLENAAEVPDFKAIMAELSRLDNN